jgi:hypothetical protein
MKVRVERTAKGDLLEHERDGDEAEKVRDPDPEPKERRHLGQCAVRQGADDDACPCDDEDADGAGGRKAEPE